MEGTKRSMRSFITTILILVLCGGCLRANGFPARHMPSQAEWTVMVFMDGDNNLELDALHDFDEIAKVGSTAKVNVVVQFDRIGKYTKNETNEKGEPYQYWEKTFRFRVGKDMKPNTENAVQAIGEANMGERQVLQDFVSWARGAYPAKRYILIIWDHGQGWRDIIPNTEENRTVFGDLAAKVAIPKRDAQIKIGQMVMADPFRSALGSPYRTASHDETDKDQLYNLEVQEALQNTAGNSKLDVLGFDACLMAMVETAYSMRVGAKVMVSSEELEPGAGWQYDDWLQTLVNDPSIDGPALGKILVESYKQQYTRKLRTTTTLSAISLGRMDELATAISTLADKLRAKIGTEAQNIKAARDECAMFAPDPFYDNKDYFFHVDFIHFCDRLLAHTHDQELRSAAQAARDLAANSVILNYAASDRTGPAGSKGWAFGASGLAIYFPASNAMYKSDQYAQDGYEKLNTFFPVEFVQKQTWTDFLHAYFQKF